MLGFTLWYPLYLAVLADPGAVSLGSVHELSARLLRRTLQRSNLQRGGGVSDRAVQGMLAPVSGAPSRAAPENRKAISVRLDGAETPRKAQVSRLKQRIQERLALAAV